MKTLIPTLTVPLSVLLTTACGSAVADNADGTTSGSGASVETSESSSSGDVLTPQTTTGGSTSGEPASSSSDTTTGLTTSAESSSTGAPVFCGSPLLDPDDRLQLANAPTRGNPDALVTLVVWTGYADPFSRSLQSTLSGLADGPLGDELRIVSKQMPLPFQDPRSRLARAGLAAHALGLYWPFHDAMFAAEDDLEPDVVDAIALDVGLDLDAFQTAMDSPEVAEQLAEDMALFAAVGGKGTPSSVVNGQFLSGAQPPEVFEEAAESQRAAMEELINDGVPACVAFEQRLDDQLP
ncbi:MAG: DsbA family protein [Nannocystales bacterium]